MTIRRRRRPRAWLRPRGETTRRLAAAGRALAAGAARYPLFPELAPTQTPQARIAQADAGAIEFERKMRRLAAKHWRAGRALLRSLARERQAEILRTWNAAGCPADASYFVSHVKTALGLAGPRQPTN